MKNLKNKLLTALLIIAGAEVGLAQSEDSTFRYDEGCLTVLGEVTYVTRNPGLSPAPVFHVPAPIPWSQLGGPDCPDGVMVRYWFDGQSAYDWRIESRVAPRYGTCLEIPFEHGLIQFQPDAATSDAPINLCGTATRSNVYAPAETNGPMAAVKINCNRRDITPNCSISDIMPNGWEARITIPKTSLQNWQVAVEYSQRFFTENLADCRQQD